MIVIGPKKDTQHRDAEPGCGQGDYRVPQKHPFAYSHKQAPHHQRYEGQKDDKVSWPPAISPPRVWLLKREGADIQPVYDNYENKEKEKPFPVLIPHAFGCPGEQYRNGKVQEQTSPW